MHYIPKEIKINNTCYNDEKSISNAFNDFFSKVGTSLANNLPLPQFENTCNIKHTTNSLFLNPISEKEVKQIISNMNIHKSTGLNDIPIKFIELSSIVISPILTNLYNKCISQGVFPNILKNSQIIPIYKKGEKNLCANYRPISLISPFSKIFQKCLFI